MDNKKLLTDQEMQWLRSEMLPLQTNFERLPIPIRVSAVIELFSASPTKQSMFYTYVVNCIYKGIQLPNYMMEAFRQMSGGDATHP